MTLVRETAAPAALQRAEPAVAHVGGLHWQRRYVLALTITDVFVVGAAMACAQMVRLGRPVTDFDPLTKYFGLLSVIFGFMWLGLLTAYRSRSPRVVGAGMEEYRRVLSATLSTIGVVAVTLMIFRPEYARGYLALAFPLGLVFLMLGRSGCRRVLNFYRRRGRCVTSVLAVGNPVAVKSLVQSLDRTWWYGYSVVGVCLTGRPGGGTLEVPGVGALPVLGDEGQVEEAIARVGADTVALTATEHLGPEGVRELSWELDRLGVDLVVSPGMVDVAGPRLTMRPVAGLPLIHVEKPQYSGTKKLQKRAFDVCVAVTVLLMAFPLLLASALAIKLTSRGPVFYLSERIGLDGKPFRMIKLRTMVQDADQMVAGLADKNEMDGGVLFKIRQDPRVTPIGRILRRYSVDELPQFINVLKKEMSVVGPRPPLPSEADSYTHQVRRRLLVLPGITGLWQVSGRSDLSWDDSVRLDLSYVENWSISGDLVIAFKTVRTVLGGVGAY
ncbi:sugar transferase [Mycolicibacterium sp. 120266]|uniref:sugar transferase n=1 Tax=Mycolicibacterium sp. 120266 TaxID=3090601 RepID=UPI00299E2BA6|nr:sugar transferase [Mycolicibacterium sp. 120266]MDX1874274.1 sugar transferase [Mycolicibacterium sp. 120266]